mmetsp:Transcript_46811/g.124301  ORF Transcript_46811/g.124301 Transcript_46811/m.124301 type:complete len:290 (+) Transcript_46811:1802-2671(+)
MCEVHQGLAHHLVECDLVRVLLLRAHNVALFILLDRHLWWLRHLRDQNTPNLFEDGFIELQLLVTSSESIGSRCFQEKRRRRVSTPLLDLKENPSAKRLPELHADFERFLVRAHRDSNQVAQSWQHVGLLCLHCWHVVLQEACEKQRYLVVEHFPEDALWSGQRSGCRTILRQLLNFFNHSLETSHNMGLVLLDTVMQTRNLAETPHAFDAVLEGVPKMNQQGLYQIRFEDVAQRNPIQEIRQRPKRRHQQRSLDCSRARHMRLKNKIAQLVDAGELGVQRILQFRDFG